MYVYILSFETAAKQGSFTLILVPSASLRMQILVCAGLPFTLLAMVDMTMQNMGDPAMVAWRFTHNTPCDHMAWQFHMFVMRWTWIDLPFKASGAPLC